MNDEEGIGGDELTPEEQDMIQQTRNSGMKPGEVVKKAMSNSKPNPDAPITVSQMPELLKRVEMASEGAIRKREFSDTVKAVVDEYPEFKGDATDLKQIQAAAAEAVGKDPEYVKWSYDETKAKLAEMTKVECERRLGKTGGKGEASAKAKETVEKRLDKESAAVDSGKGGGRSAQPTHETDDEDFDGSVCGTGDDKAFAMTDQELNARFSQKAQKFLRKERGQKV